MNSKTGKKLLYMSSLDKAAASLKPLQRQHAHEIPKTPRVLGYNSSEF